MPPTARFRNAALIHNPLAGQAIWRSRRSLDHVVELLAAYGLTTQLIQTTGPGSATVLAREQVAAGRDLIIVCGGDGTVNEVVNGMAGSQVPLALLPAGTGNALAKELELPWDPWRAAEYIPQGIVRRIALGRAGERYFISLAGAGADASMVYHLGQRSKLHLGIWSYWLEGFRHLFVYDFPEFSVRVGESTVSGTLLVVSRIKHYGGPIQITRRADLFGNDFEVCVFPRRFPLVYFAYFLAQLVGRLESFGEVRFLRGRRVRAEPAGSAGGARGARIHVQADGEYAGRLPMEFVIVPEALSLLVPAGAGGHTSATLSACKALPYT